MTVELIEIEAFVKIAEVGGFTRAAAALHLSQPAIGRRIELLEQGLAAPLFERTPAGARLTDAGRAFLPFAEAVLAATRDGVEAVRAVEAGDAGTVRLALVGTLAGSPLTERLRRFRAAHPGVRVVLQTARSDEVGGMVLRGDANLGLRYFPDPHPEIVSQTVGEEALIVVCAAERAARLEPAADARALVGVPWVGFPRGSGSGPAATTEPYARILTRQLAAAGLDDAELVAIDSLTAQKRLIEADFGVGLLPARGVEDELRLGSLRELDIPALRTTIPVVAVHRRRGYLSPAARGLLAELSADMAAP